MQSIIGESGWGEGGSGGGEVVSGGLVLVVEEQGEAGLSLLVDARARCRETNRYLKIG
jgi:hypothetical protein